LHLDGDGEAHPGPGHPIRQGGARCRAAPNAGLQPEPVLQLGQRRHDGRADGELHLGLGEAGILLAVHHARRLPLRRPEHRPLRQGIREEGGLRLCVDDPKGGAQAQ
ncbi:unnamed protein product, partial [Effrenium voratum]